ncbi:MAG: penicillin acylase family protein [Acidobacteriota bacterium]|nr:MAG: penicillin acylase family protein [Acidobacteriota bacterium]
MGPFKSKRWLKGGLFALTAAILLVVLAGGYAYWRVWLSLPLLDGEILVRGLSDPVTIERDERGFATVRAGRQTGVSRGLGFLHAQERFFQMDLMRRQAAGELAELLGEPLLEHDLAARVHQFRLRAAEIIASLPPKLREQLNAYTSGVNQGLEFLSEKPFEYLILRSEPMEWRPEDSLLVLFSMFFVLNDESGRRESDNGVLFETLPPELAAFLSPEGTEWDASMTGETLAHPPVPGPEIWNARTGSSQTASALSAVERAAVEELSVGSNNWAVAGSRTFDGRALIADDMHLGTSVPNTWFKSQLEWEEEGNSIRVTGVTLPGTPGVTAGSNGSIAWGFTNSGGDWSDLITLELDPRDSTRYLTPEGFRSFEIREETIQVSGEDPRRLEIQSTIWGPVLDRDHLENPRVLRWTAHLPGAANLTHFEMARAKSLEEALETANQSGIPPQNFVCADSQGRIAWTIEGAIPRRIGFSGRLPTSWSDGTHRWDGWLTPEEYPRLVDPSEGLLWTANARMVGGEMLTRIGVSGFDIGARAGQIRDALRRLERASESDMLAIQLDDRALFLERWRNLILELLDQDSLAGSPGRREFRRLVADGWSGRASIDSVGFRLTRTFRLQAFENIFGWLTAPCKQADERFSVYSLHQWEAPLWTLVTERPMHLLDSGYPSWEEALLLIVDKTIELFGSPDQLKHKTWGDQNTARIQHPLSQALPLFSRWLDMPATQLPGDDNMPRAQGQRFGASERFSVSPGREEEGYLHMPAGQSGHPLSPFYRAGHEAWEQGKPLPFLPGRPVHTLVLLP